MNKLLVNVDEVSITQQQANDIKNMIPGETMMFEKKGSNKITFKSHMYLICDDMIYVDVFRYELV